VPKIHYVPPVSGVFSGAWTSTGNFLDFEIPKGVGVLRNTTLRLDVAQTASNANVPPVPFLIQQIEVTIGSTTLETLYPNDIYNETVGFLNASEKEAEANILLVPGFVAQAGKSSTDKTDENFTVTKPAGFVAYLPFNNCLTCPGIFCDGLTETIRYRVYFPSGAVPNTTSLNSATLIIEEDVGTRADRHAWEQASEEGTVYSTVVRQRMNTSISKNASDYTLDLTGINGSSAGYVVYAGPAVQPGTTTVSYYYQAGAPEDNAVNVVQNQLLATRYPMTALELDDQMGNKRTERLYGDMLTAQTWPDHIGTNFATNAYSSTYLLPFCDNFREAVTNGLYSGHLWSDGRDRLVISGPKHTVSTSFTGADTWNFTVTNYQYQAFVVKNKKLVEVMRNPHRGVGTLGF